MTMFQVWAPMAERLELVLGARRLAMHKGPEGVWRVSAADAGPGTDYAFSVDGSAPRPDPRSPWQPQGVFGPSRVVDHGAFSWTDGAFRPPSVADGVIYELHVGTFTRAGTFDGACARLGDLVALGITHVEIMPVAAAPGTRGWGYDGVGLYAPTEAYGGPEGLRRFVDACHARGLGVLLDVVYNHLGPSGNFLGVFGPYFTDRYATPWGQAVNLDGPHSDHVRRFFIDNACMWLRDYHIDGLRLDAVHAFIDHSAVHFLEELAASVQALSAETGRPLWVIAESDLNDPRLIRSVDAGGYGLEAMWSDDFHHALHAVITGERTGYYEDFGHLADIAKALRSGLVYDGAHSRHRLRRHGRPLDGLSGRRLVSFLQNHDQIGNRARGERLHHLADLERVKAGAALVLTGPFVPLLFQGEEWATRSPFAYFTDHEDPELAEAVREGRRREFAAFGWRPEDIPDPQAIETFRQSQLDWQERDRAPHADVLAWYRALIELRRQTPELRDGRFDRVFVSVDESTRSVTMARGHVVVVAHFGDGPLAITTGSLPRPSLLDEGPVRLHLGSRPGIVLDQDRLRLPGPAAAVLIR